MNVRSKQKKIMRHQMTRFELVDLYYRLCEFIEDCTREEVDKYRDHIVAIKELVSYRINEQ